VGVKWVTEDESGMRCSVLMVGKRAAVLLWDRSCLRGAEGFAESGVGGGCVGGIVDPSAVSG
jgi:hypothetical protein